MSVEFIKEREERLIKAAKNPAKMRAKIRLCKDLISFGRVCMPGTSKVTSPDFHEDLAHTLIDVDRQLINAVAPRGHAKSSLICAIFALWHVFLEDLYRYLIGDTPVYKKTKKFVVLISKTQGEANRRLDTIKEVLGNENGEYEGQFRALFGNYGYGTHRTWTRTELILRNGDGFITKGTGQHYRGIKLGNQRPTVVLTDDPEDEENTKTPERMAQNLGWLLQAVVPSLDANTGRAVVIGTPQNHGCMVVTLHGATGWTSKWYGNDAATNKSTWDGENYDKDGVLWPDYISREDLQAKFDMAQSMGRLASYYREYECKIVGDEDQLFKPEYFRDWEGELRRDAADKPYLYVTARSEQNGKLVTLQEPEILPVCVTMGIDPASSTNRRADYSAISIVAQTKQKHFYLIELIRRRMPPAKLLETIKNTWEIYKPDRGQCETTQAQEYIVDLLRGEGIFLRGRKPRQGKEERLVQQEPIFSQGRFFTRPIHQDMKQEYMSFPRGRHDDTMDSIDLATDCSYLPSHFIILDAVELNKKKKGKYYDYMVA